MYKKERENKRNASPYIGVSFARKRWYARVKHNGTTFFLGAYDDPKEAAKAYDLYVIKNNLDRKTNFFKKRLV